jgi:hypothetical protein
MADKADQRHDAAEQLGAALEPLEGAVGAVGTNGNQAPYTGSGPNFFFRVRKNVARCIAAAEKNAGTEQ